jgi:2-polyprenyl-3-methyl-5-hydroxy-6-metoxy-1,4-benzoquinol methylase
MIFDQTLCKPVPHCDICESSEFRPIADRDRDGQPLSTVICGGCGMVFTNPRPTAEAIEKFYRQDYRVAYKEARSPRPKHTYRAGKVALERLGYLAPILTPGCKVLDLGSGGGELLFLLRAKGYDAAGIEPNEGYGEYARDVLGLPVQLGAYQQASVEPASLDVVTSFHVVEHLERPVEALSTLAGWLKPGGRMLIEVPNIQSTVQWPKSRFHQAHLQNFTPKTLAMAGRRAGLEVKQAGTSDDGGNVICIFQKPSAATSPISGAEARIPGHAQEIESLLKNHGTLRHALTLAPYTRPFKKLARQWHEKKVLGSGKSGKALLEAMTAQ